MLCKDYQIVQGLFWLSCCKNLGAVQAWLIQGSWELVIQQPPDLPCPAPVLQEPVKGSCREEPMLRTNNLNPVAKGFTRHSTASSSPHTFKATTDLILKLLTGAQPDKGESTC